MKPALAPFLQVYCTYSTYSTRAQYVQYESLVRTVPMHSSVAVAPRTRAAAGGGGAEALQELVAGQAKRLRYAQVPDGLRLHCIAWYEYGIVWQSAVKYTIEKAGRRVVTERQRNVTIDTTAGTSQHSYKAPSAQSAHTTPPTNPNPLSLTCTLSDAFISTRLTTAKGSISMMCPLSSCRGRDGQR